MKKLCYRIPGAHVARIAPADFVCFHCPLVAPAGAIPPRNEKDQLQKNIHA